MALCFTPCWSTNSGENNVSQLVCLKVRASLDATVSLWKVVKTYRAEPNQSPCDLESLQKSVSLNSLEKNVQIFQSCLKRLQQSAADYKPTIRRAYRRYKRFDKKMDRVQEVLGYISTPHPSDMVESPVEVSSLEDVYSHTRLIAAKLRKYLRRFTRKCKSGRTRDRKARVSKCELKKRKCSKRRNKNKCLKNVKLGRCWMAWYKMMLNGLV